MSPREVEQITLWEIAASVDAMNRLNGAPEPVEAMSDDEFDALIARKMVPNAKS